MKLLKIRVLKLTIGLFMCGAVFSLKHSNRFNVLQNTVKAMEDKENVDGTEDNNYDDYSYYNDDVTDGVELMIPFTKGKKTFKFYYFSAKDIFIYEEDKSGSKKISSLNPYSELFQRMFPGCEECIDFEKDIKGGIESKFRERFKSIIPKIEQQGVQQRVVEENLKQWREIGTDDEVKKNTDNILSSKEDLNSVLDFYEFLIKFNNIANKMIDIATKELIGKEMLGAVVNAPVSKEEHNECVKFYGIIKELCNDLREFNKLDDKWNSDSEKKDAKEFILRECKFEMTILHRYYRYWASVFFLIERFFQAIRTSSFDIVGDYIKSESERLEKERKERERKRREESERKRREERERERKERKEREERERKRKEIEEREEREEKEKELEEKAAKQDLSKEFTGLDEKDLVWRVDLVNAHKKFLSELCEKSNQKIENSEDSDEQKFDAGDFLEKFSPFSEFFEKILYLDDKGGYIYSYKKLYTKMKYDIFKKDRKQFEYQDFCDIGCVCTESYDTVIYLSNIYDELCKCIKGCVSCFKNFDIEIIYFNEFCEILKKYLLGWCLFSLNFEEYVLEEYEFAFSVKSLEEEIKKIEIITVEIEKMEEVLGEWKKVGKERRINKIKEIIEIIKKRKVNGELDNEYNRREAKKKRIEKEGSIKK